MNTILIVDDEKNQRDILSYILQKENLNTLTAASAEEALKAFAENEVDVVLSDLMLPKMDGLELLGELLSQSPETSVIIITGHGTIDSAVTAIKRGAFDYITKPLQKDNVIAVVKKAFERTNLLKERKYLVSRLSATKELNGVIGEHPVFKNVIKTIFKIAPFDATVLITGDSGTGKEVIAKTIHNISPRKDHPFIPVNCAALPDSLIESELFGYTAGAFTGASKSKKGLFEAASRGTIFLDEISEIPPNTQAKLLRVLQSKEVLPLGSTTPVEVDVRIIAATNRNLEEKVKNNEFRADLFYRINIFSIKMPLLRERSSDIPLLANFFLEKYRYLTGGRTKFFSTGALKLFLDYQWTGNIRELESVVQKAVLYSDSDEIKDADVAPLLSPAFVAEIAQQAKYAFPPANSNQQVPPAGNRSLDDIEKEAIVNAMEQSDWKMNKASEILGISRFTLRYRMAKYNITKKCAK